MRLFLHFFFCLFIGGGTLYLLIVQQNRLNELRREIPLLSREYQNLEKENDRIQYAIDQFANPLYLLERSRDPLFGQLRFPKVDEVIVLPEPPPLNNDWPEDAWETSG